MRWPWTILSQQLKGVLANQNQFIETQQGMARQQNETRLEMLNQLSLLRTDLQEALPPLIEMVSRLSALADAHEKRRIEEEAMVGQTWLMSPGEQADKERELLAESTRRMAGRHYRRGSNK